MKKILVATPCYGGIVSSEYTLSLLNLICNNNDPNIRYTIYTLGNESLITRARNKCVAYFLAGDFTHLLFIDSDIGFESSVAHRVINYDKDVVCALYPRKAIQWENINKLIQKNIPLNEKNIKNAVVSFNHVKSNSVPNEYGFVEVNYAATGFMCIKREVFDKMRKHYPEQQYNAVETEEYLLPHMWLFFDCMVDENKKYLSEDFAFCKKWKDIGGKIWLDTVSNLTHCGTYRFNGDTQYYFEQLNKN